MVCSAKPDAVILIWKVPGSTLAKKNSPLPPDNTSWGED
jgi:hypothetical protein